MLGFLRFFWGCSGEKSKKSGHKSCDPADFACGFFPFLVQMVGKDKKAGSLFQDFLLTHRKSSTFFFFFCNLIFIDVDSLAMIIIALMSFYSGVFC